MPLQAGTLTSSPVDTTGGQLHPPHPGSIYATWTDPSGVVWELTNTDDAIGYFTTQEISGWGAAPYEIIADPLSRGGEQVRYVRAQPARIVWPLHVWGNTHLEFVQRVRALRRAFTMTVHRGQPGTLTVLRPDGHGRQIECFYEDGFAGQGGEDWCWANPVVTLYAPNGYWRDTEPTTIVRQHSPSATAFLNPFPTVSSGLTLGLTSVDNPGDVVAWPLWTVTGPMTSLVATNHTTGDSFTLTYTLLAGQTAVINTERGTIRDAADANLVGAINWPSAVLWGLLPGANEIEATIAGGTVNQSKIELEFYARHEGA